VYAVNLRETTCFVVFNTIKKLEDYVAIVHNMSIYVTINNLYTFLEKVIVYNWKVVSSA
jgi:hypothetical protein